MNRQEKNEATQQRIVSALVSLIDTKGFTNITVSDITRVAKLSRGTFYIYYLDKYDLLKKIETKLIANMEQLMQTNLDKTIYWVDSHKHEQTANRLDYSPYKSIIQSFDYLDQNRIVLNALLSKNGDPQFLYQLKALMDRQITLHNDNIFIHEENMMPHDYQHVLLVNSIISIIGHWLQKETPESPIELADILINSRLLAPYHEKNDK